MRPVSSSQYLPGKIDISIAFPPGCGRRTPRYQALTALPEKPVREPFADSRKSYVWPWLTCPEKLLARNSIEHLFVKDYDGLYIILGV
jgi:hypothetical protein